MAEKLVKIFDKGGKKEVKRVEITTTGESVKLKFVVKNISKVVVHNVRLDILPVSIVDITPKIMPVTFGPGEKFNLSLTALGDHTEQIDLKILYDFVEVKMF